MTTARLAHSQARLWNTRRPWRPTLAQTPAWAGAVSIAVGIAVLIGWLVEADTARSVVSGLLATKANAAVCFVLMGAGLTLVSRAAPNARTRFVGLALVAAAMTIALLTTSQDVTRVDLGIDQLLVRDGSGQVGTVVPGRMSPLTAFCFTLIGSAIFLSGRKRRLAMATSGAALVVATMNVFDFVFGAGVPSFLASYTQMAIVTAVAMGILALGAIGLLGSDSPLAVLGGRSPTASLWRRLLVVSLVSPVVMAWLRLEGQHRGLYDSAYGTSLMLVAILTLAVVAIVRSALWATELDTKRASMELERDRFFELSLDMLAVVAADGRFSRVNRAWQSTLGYRADELVGRPFLDLVHPADLGRTTAEAQRHYGEGKPTTGFQNRYRHRDGSYRWLEWMSQTSPDGSIAFAVARDVTDRKASEDRRAKQRRSLKVRADSLAERATRDPLTGLHNRRYFDDAVPDMQRRWKRLPVGRRPPVAIVIFDLDHFGQVNKQHGHQAGDAVLRLFSGLLTKRFRRGDLIVRYGGEEFVVVLENATSADAMRLAESVRLDLEGASVDIGTDEPIRVTASAGCAALADGDVSAGIALADVWLSQAKRSGRNQVVGL